MITVEFTEQEIAALRQLLHRAVLHSGMDVAEAAVMITQKLVAATRVPPPPPPPKLNAAVGETT